MVTKNVAKALERLRELGLPVSWAGPNQLIVNDYEATLETRLADLDSKSMSYEMAVYVLDKISPANRRLAAERKQLILVATITGEVWLFGSQLAPPQNPNRHKNPSTNADYARYGLLRSLARTSQPRTQIELARELDVTPDTVSQNLDNISDLVIQTSSGWSAKSFDLVSEEFLETYPGHGGFEDYWFSETPITAQGRKVLESNPDSLISADCAADELAPHRMLRTAMVYLEKQIDFEALGFTNTTRRNATLFEIVPRDTTIFPVARSAGNSPLADGLLVAFDLRRSAGPDNIEASFKLLDELWKQWNDSRR